MKKEEKELRILPNSSKGLSTIVATLIIILLVLVAAGIIWVVVRNIITEGAEGIELGRFTLDLSIKAAYIDGTNIKVNVRRSSGEGDLIGVRFIFFNGTGSISVDRNIPLIPTQERLFSFNSSDVGDINVYQEVSVAPIYESSSGKETVGDITDTATISSSAPPGDNGGWETGPPNTGYCGDTIIQNPNGEVPPVSEVCDGTNLGGEGCISQGFDGGNLACNVGCLSFDFSLCTLQVPASCNGSWNPPEDPGVECDGGVNCNLDCTCSVGFIADEAGGCNLNPPINLGDIFLVWPEDGNAHRFKSPDIPKDQFELQSYTSYYVNFSNSPETRCFRIQTASYFEDVNISEIGLLINFLFDPLANVSQGQQYSIWEAAYCGIPQE